ncbi:MAG: hypothetical protein AAGF12_07820, partial [Myxococcota bacterium]
ALDGGSLERAREAGVPFCVALFPGFDLAWAGDLELADLVLVPDAELIPSLVSRNVPRDRLEAIGPIAPAGFSPPNDRAALRESLDLPPHSLCLVPGALADGVGVETLLVQLSLAAGPIGFLFDVGTDAELADALRERVPPHGLDAWIFAEEPDSYRVWQSADVVIGRARGYEVGRAVGVGAPLLLLPPGRLSRDSGSALEAAKVAEIADSVVTLAVSLDRLLDPEAFDEARAAVASLEVGSVPDRLAKVVRERYKEHRKSRSRRARGLPHGLERLSGESERRSGMSLEDGRSKDEPREPPDAERTERESLDDRIERELEALKAKLGKG